MLCLVLHTVCYGEIAVERSDSKMATGKTSSGTKPIGNDDKRSRSDSFQKPHIPEFFLLVSALLCFGARYRGQLTYVGILITWEQWETRKLYGRPKRR